jgi:hypothetical protein
MQKTHRYSLRVPSVSHSGAWVEAPPGSMWVWAKGFLVLVLCRSVLGQPGNVRLSMRALELAEKYGDFSDCAESSLYPTGSFLVGVAMHFGLTPGCGAAAMAYCCTLTKGREQLYFSRRV